MEQKLNHWVHKIEIVRTDLKHIFVLCPSNFEQTSDQKFGHCATDWNDFVILRFNCCPHSSSLCSPPAHLIFPVIDKSFDYFINICFISLDPNTLHFIDSLSKLQIQNIRLVMMLVSLHTQTVMLLASLHAQTLLHCLTIQVLNMILLHRYLVHFSDFCTL